MPEIDASAEAFLNFARPHWRRLHAAARQYVGGPSDAEDLVQEVLLRAWRNFTPTDATLYRRAWLFAIMRNVVLEWRRSAGRRIRINPATDVELTEPASADPGEPLCQLPAMDELRFREFLDDRVAAALDALDDPFREVLVLSVAAELNYREIAKLIDCPVGTVMSRMARARRMLRERLAAYAHEHRLGQGTRS